MLERLLADAHKTELAVNATDIQQRMDYYQISKVERLERALKTARTHLRLGAPTSATMR